MKPSHMKLFDNLSSFSVIDLHCIFAVIYVYSLMETKCQQLPVDLILSANVKLFKGTLNELK